jgi:hypothetical protein
MLLQIVFLYLKQNIQGVFLSEAKKKKKKIKKKEPISKGSSLLPPA